MQYFVHCKMLLFAAIRHNARDSTHVTQVARRARALYSLVFSAWREIAHSRALMVKKALRFLRGRTELRQQQVDDALLDYIACGV